MLTPEERKRRRRRYYQANRDKVLARQKRYQKQDPEKHRARIRKTYLNRTYGPGAAMHYEQMFAKQQGKCAICGRSAHGGPWSRLHQDHDTKCCPYAEAADGSMSKQVKTCGKCRRGLLCGHCNAVLARIERPEVEDKQ
jgi:Recombination endonuclease VII